MTMVNVNEAISRTQQFNRTCWLKEFPSLTEAARSANISKSSIMQVTQGKRLTAGGFV